jgi:hypothetical protein
LQAQKKEYRDTLKDYNIAVQEYPEKKRLYEEYKAKGELSWIFDMLNLFFPFVAIVGLQVMNGYSSKMGARKIDRKDPEPDEPELEKKKKIFPWRPKPKKLEVIPEVIRTEQQPLPSESQSKE